MDVKMIPELIVIGIGLIIIGMGAIMFYLGRYLSATADKKQDQGKNFWEYGIVWLCMGLAYLIGSLLVLHG